MAATDTYELFTASLTDREKEVIAPLAASARADLLAARSEDARLRIVAGFIEEAHHLLHQPPSRR